MMKLVCLGGGPLVCSDATPDNLREADPVSAETISAFRQVRMNYSVHPIQRRTPTWATWSLGQR
ncbi:hypothetical protein ABIE13_002451 [Ottowia thiooxydans]|uniref:Uncharacterized protein n=1 Tax=Ottowia thiooxydans TaxID=219182 RepID=A0ABV2Q8I3_9BURK